VKTQLDCLAALSKKRLVTFKKGITLKDLEVQARQKTDLKAAQEMQTASLPCSTSLRSKSGLDLEARQPADWSLSDGILNGPCVA